MNETLTDLISLPFRAVVYPEIVDGVGTVWMAQSVFSCHAAHADTPEEAHQLLLEAIAAAVRAALLDRLTIERWFADQIPNEPSCLERMKRVTPAGSIQLRQLLLEELSIILASAGVVDRAA